TVTRSHSVTIPGSTPPGSYDVALNIGDFGSLDVCDAAAFTFTFGVEREGQSFATKAEAEQAAGSAVRPAARPAATVGALVLESEGIPGDVFATATSASAA